MEKVKFISREEMELDKMRVISIRIERIKLLWGEIEMGWNLIEIEEEM